MGGPKGSKIKIPIPVESLASLQPVLIAGGSKSLFVLTQRGKVPISFNRYFVAICRPKCLYYKQIYKSVVFSLDLCMRGWKQWPPW